MKKDDYKRIPIPNKLWKKLNYILPQTTYNNISPLCQHIINSWIDKHYIDMYEEDK